MIKRVVRLTVKDAAAKEAFQEIYRSRNPYKNGVKGCQDVKVMKDVNEDNVYYTVSLWDRNEDLEAYRQSDYFAETWPMVKAQLSKRAEAFSMTETDIAV